MSFPQTRLTLIRRLSSGGSDSDWRQFLEDYWGPTCGFAQHWGGLSPEDAEDVASETFQTIIRKGLLARWEESPMARLRTLICAVARNLIANQARLAKGRQRILRDLAQSPASAASPAVWASAEPAQEDVDALYQAWVDDLLATCVERLFHDLHRSGKGDYFRVLFGHVCEGLSMPEIGHMLSLPVTAVESHYKATKKRLADELRQAVRRQTERYSEPDAHEVFEEEWLLLSRFLREHGGLEQAVRDSHERHTGMASRRQRATAQSRILAKIAARPPETAAAYIKVKDELVGDRE